MGKYQCCVEMDINLEHENRAVENAMFRSVYNTVKNYNSIKLVNICLL